MAAVAFASPELFERTLLRGTLGAAAGGLLAGLIALTAGVASPVTLALVLAGALAALGNRRTFVILGVLGLLAGALVALTNTYPTFYLAAAGALAGSGISLARYLSGEGDGRRISLTRVALVAIAGAGAILVGTETVAVFASHGFFDGVPVPLAFAARGALAGFFFGLSGSALHVQAGTDPVDAAYDAIAGELTGELARLSSQAVDLYRRCREALARSPQSAARAHVGRSLVEVTTRTLDVARRWHAVDLELGERAESDVDKRLTEVRALIAKSTDATAKRQLQAAERALTEEQAQISRIRAGRERVLARLHADLAILERTRFALLALRCTDAHMLATELSHLSENLSALGREMDGEAQAIDDALKAAAVTPVPSPVVPVASTEPVAAPVPMKDPTS